MPSGSVSVARYATAVPGAIPPRSSVIEYAGDELSSPIASQSPPATLRSNATSCVARSGSANSRSSTLPRWREPSRGASQVSAGGGTSALRGALRRVWPALSRTVARYWTVVPACSPDTSWNTR